MNRKIYVLKNLRLIDGSSGSTIDRRTVNDPGQNWKFSIEETCFEKQYADPDTRYKIYQTNLFDTNTESRKKNCENFGVSK